LKNNADINFENKLAWPDKNVLYVQDLLNNQGNYLTPQEFSNKKLSTILQNHLSYSPLSQKLRISPYGP